MSGQDVTMESVGDRITEFGFYLDAPYVNAPYVDTCARFYNHPSHDWMVVSVYPKYRVDKILVVVDDLDVDGGEFDIIVESVDGFDEEFKRALGAIKLGRL